MTTTTTTIEESSTRRSSPSSRYYRHPQIVSKATAVKGNSVFFQGLCGDESSDLLVLEKGSLLLREPLFAFGLRGEYEDVACHRCLSALNSSFGFSSSLSKLSCDLCQRVWYCSEECEALNRSIHNSSSDYSKIINSECHYLRFLHIEGELVFQELQVAMDQQR